MAIRAKSCYASAGYMQLLTDFRSQFEPVLEAYLVDKQQKCEALTPDADVAAIIRYSSDLVKGGGKRVRPYITWLMYQGCKGKKSQAILQYVVALELFHLFGLVHDDIIDHGTDRHGIPTTHLAVAKRLRAQKRFGELGHIAEGQAILLGDLLFAWSAEIASMAGSFPPSQRLLALRRFYAMADEVVVGQMLDVDVMTRHTTEMQRIDEKMRLKTASYTFIRPMQIGAALAGTTARVDRFCEAFGLALGLAFQIQDDLLDLTADAKTLKKTVFSDLRDHQHTFFTQYVFDAGTPAQKKELKKRMGTSVSEKDRPRIQELFHASGAFDAGQRQVNAYFSQAAQVLQGVRLAPISKQGLAELLAYLRDRQA